MIVKCLGEFANIQTGPFGSQLHNEEYVLQETAIDKGMPIEQLQRILGHQRIVTILQFAMVKQNNVKTSYRKY